LRKSVATERIGEKVSGMVWWSAYPIRMTGGPERTGDGQKPIESTAFLADSSRLVALALRALRFSLNGLVEQTLNMQVPGIIHPRCGSCGEFPRPVV
jgi:hypothetical protein